MSALDASLGMILIGAIVSTAMYGTACAQGIFYYKKFGKEDSRQLKGLIATLLVVPSLIPASSKPCNNVSF
ncbi:hypothetical protein GLOTRDRAFT_131763 [Gloeophyllum trabeum ATCC 11539]|uniref:Uncharacterized protein n=1 Tax=Gloeophyllum trabeum (strain ATCC 11539 / FP-39264 / Madison 617) TaxID=670483 RepID=S7PYJ6_GLOTA|nr:uncharacterized protein GLOTRDRAFT_131763 [Gloeophyllum trabeum ATCC 11539]EPQ52523.1 hypothetical protein GLOTRDRAFT_131763 [Gloeophyllum trabeum ATCC 11539]